MVIYVPQARNQDFMILCGWWWGWGGEGFVPTRPKWTKLPKAYRNVFFIVWSVYLGKKQYMRNCNGKYTVGTEYYICRIQLFELSYKEVIFTM